MHVETSPAATSPQTAFRRAEVFWRARGSTAALDQAFDATRVKWSEAQTASWSPTRPRHGPECRVRRKPLDDSSYAVAFDELPGLLLLPDFLAPALQRDLVREALREAAVSPPNTTSLDAHYNVPTTGIWSAARARPDEIVERVALGSKKAETASKILQRLRWATVGVIYDWTHKIYLFERPSPPVPRLIAETCESVVRQIDWTWAPHDPDGTPTFAADSYRAEAGLVNFYHPKHTLTGHVDQAEEDACSPLVSISIGLPAVFLVGGHTRDVAPLPLYLSSGSVVVMAGPARRAVHGVPRVFEGPIPESMLADESDAAWESEGFASYMTDTRINLNVRQVHT